MIKGFLQFLSRYLLVGSILILIWSNFIIFKSIIILIITVVLCISFLLAEQYTYNAYDVEEEHKVGNK